MNAVSLTYIYFFYGLAFFALGLAVLMEIGRTSELRFARSLPWLAAFGLIHGGHEWIEMFEAIGILARLAVAGRAARCPARGVVRVPERFWLQPDEPDRPASRRSAMWRTLALIGVCLGGMGLLRFWFQPSEWIVVAGVWARYSLGVVGAVITSWALVSEGRVFAGMGMARFGRDLVWAAVAFALYGMVGQVFVQATRLPPSNLINADLFLRLFGVPVQVLRGVLAVVVAIFHHPRAAGV